jgi:universal stress protein E
MSTKSEILVVVEPDNHPEIVAARAAWIAGLRGCDLTLLWCDSDIGPLDSAFLVSNEARDIADQIGFAQHQMVEEIADSIRSEQLAVCTSVVNDRPIGEAILQLVQEQKPEFVVKGTQYHRAAERSIFVDTDWQLMRGCTCPLWLVKPVEFSDQPVIVAAVDPVHSHDKPASLDKRIVEYSKSIADQAGGDLHLFHAYQPMSAIGAAANRTFKPVKISIEETVGELREEHQKKLNEFSDSCNIDKKHSHQQAGVPRELIPAFAREMAADLVVMGVQARWGLKRAIIGSTAERVLDHLPCDILLICNED